eukprot:2738218-Pleurochrysis_carterae.AAC.2
MQAIRRAVTRGVGGHDELVAGAEAALRAALRAKLSNGQEGVLEGRGAPHVAEDDGARNAVRVVGEQVELADGGALPGFLVDPHDVLRRWPSVDQVRLGRMYMPGAPAVDDEGQPAVSAAGPFQPVVPAGEKGASGCGRLSAFNAAASSPGRAAAALPLSGGATTRERYAHESRECRA